MYCETAKVWRVAGMFKYYRKDPPLRLCGVLMSPPDWAEKKLNFFSRSLWPPLFMHITAKICYRNNHLLIKEHICLIKKLNF